MILKDFECSSVGAQMELGVKTMEAETPLKQRDLMCIVRYALYGALLGGFFASLFKNNMTAVIGGAIIGGLLLILLKVLIVDAKK